jgi:spermidine synthase
MTSAPPAKPSETARARLEIAATFLVSTAMLGIQIGWTRIFSFMIWYHFAFLVISTAMLGFTVGGLLLNLRPQLLERPRADLLFPSALGFCVTSSAALLIVCNLPFDGGVLDTLRNFGLFLILMLVVSAAFTAAGLFTAVMIARRPEGVARIYAANLLGSGFGCALAVPLLDRLLPASTVLAFVLTAWLALPLLIPLRERRRRASLLALVTLLVVGSGLLVSLDPLAAPFYMRSTKDFPGWSKQRILARLSNSLSTIDVFEAQELTGLWGLSDRRYALDTGARPYPERVGFVIDGWALTFGYGSAQGDIVSEPVFDYLPSTLAYDVASPKSALVIGAGGGIDVICALRRGVREVTAVEINEITMKVSLAMARFNGGIFRRPGVEPVVAEGRAFVAAAGERRWDLIQLSGVDTLAASQAGAFTLAESYLYTREAFEAYLRQLNPGGLLTLTRWMSDPPRQTLRVITVADAALRSLGITDTSAHIMLVTDVRHGFSVFVISVTPFSAAQSQRALAAARARDFVPLALPHQQLAAPPNAYERLLALPDKAAFIDDYPFDISVTTDDKPFFFEHTKWKNAWKYPDRIFDRFNGHLILIVTALVVALLGVVFILVPARFGLSREQRSRGHQRALAYFACLGLGYVLVEMVLVQKLTLYLGNPSYALAVVLCGMLIFSGLGSLLSVRLRAAARPRAVAVAALAVAVTLLAYRFGLDACLQATLAQPVATRIALALALLALPATLMGMPFPAAVAALGDTRRGLVVRGWVINGYCSVLGSCVTMILSISAGFALVLLTGAVIYGAAALLWPERELREPRELS